jgi:hypothetical protein
MASSSKLSAVDDQAVRPWSICRDVRLWHKADMLNTLTDVRFWGDCVAKVGGTRLLRNNRIQEACRLNQSCATY